MKEKLRKRSSSADGSRDLERRSSGSAMSRPRRFTVDEALQAMMEKDDDDFLGLGLLFGDSESDLGDESGDQPDELVTQRRVATPTTADADSSDSDPEHPLDRVVHPADVVSRYCGVQREELSGGEESGRGDEASELGAKGAASTVSTRRMCGCQSNCMSMFDERDVEQNILSMREMEKKEKDLVILGLLESLRHNSERTLKGKKRQRERFVYHFQGARVCVGAFRILYDVGKKHMENLIAHLEREGPVPRVHGNTGRRPHNTLPYSDVKNVVVFIDNFATEFGIPHPAPLHGRSDAPPVFLPAAETYKSVHAKYVESCIHAERRAAGMSLFCSIWKQCLPHIKFMSPRSDVCDACEKNRRRVTEAVTEEEKLAASAALSKHILLAQREREFYKQKTVDAKAEWDIQGQDIVPPCAPCSNDLRLVHYTFDFAQNVCLPHTARQVGPLYFKTPFKVQLFGVNSEAIPKQVNYLLGENDTIGEDGKKSHNPNTVVSLLHHFFDCYGHGEKECFLHADNCAGQNKNKTVLAYLAWRCLKGLHERICLSFMIAGHTRCLVDGCFGLLKRKYRRSDCFTMEQLAEVVNSSAAPNVAQLMPGSGISWREWDAFFVGHFRKVPNISRMHHFEFTSTSLTATVRYRESLDDEWMSTDLLKTTKEQLIDAGLPPVIPAGGLSLKRQAYLHSDIRPFVPDAYKDTLCPAPPAPPLDNE